MQIFTPPSLYLKMTQEKIIDALITRDEQITRQFFFKDCRPLFVSIIRSVFSYEVDYDEFVNEFYLYLMENDAYRLKQFEGRSSVYQWLKIVAIRYFISKRNHVVDMESKEALLDKVSNNSVSDAEQKTIARIDMFRLFSLMPNKRYVYVIKRLVLDDVEPQKVAGELDVTVDNLYNIKKRAIAALTKIAINEADKYGKRVKK